MSKSANPTLIGGFVVGAAVLAVAGLAFFGGGKFLAKKSTYVAFFEGSVKGLNIGSPVTFRGVRIGAVSNIVVRYDSDDHSVRIPVYFDLEQGRVDVVRHRARDPYQNIRALIENDGLRAQLVTQSFVTGQVAVDLSFHPDTPVTLLGVDSTHPEFPTISSTMQKMGKAFEDFDLEALLTNIDSAVCGIDELANSPELRDAIASLDQTIKDYGKLARDLDAKVNPIAGNIDDTSVAAIRAMDQFTKSLVSVEGTMNSAFEDAGTLVQHIDEQVKPLVSKIMQIADTAQAALEQARQMLAVAKNDLSPDSELYQGVIVALDELAGAARSIRILADLLEQHPEALLKGKGAGGVQ